MRAILALAATAAILTGCSTTPEASQSASAVLRDAQGVEKGTVRVTGIDRGIRVDLKVTGIPAGRHGVHIHTVGRCDGPAFETAKGHWNPGNNVHGLSMKGGPHRGDLPNLVVRGDGTGRLTANISGGVIAGEPGALLDQDGAAFIVHAEIDDMRTDPSGNSGARIACGVFAAG